MLQRMRELLEEKQYSVFRSEISELNEADIAMVLEELEEQEQFKVFRILPKTIAADVFSYLPIEIQQNIITSLSDKEAALIIENLFADDAADLMEEMPANVVKRLLASANSQTRRDINQLLQYPEASAGSIMTVEFVDLKEDVTVEQALLKIRRVGVDKEVIENCYVLDKARCLHGIVSLRKLILSEPDQLIKDIMNEYVITVKTVTDQEEVAQIFKKYDFTSMPVVDSENRLVGIVTIDDIVDIIEEETTRDFEMMAAITPTDKPYMKTGVFETWKKRAPWLLLLMISATFTSSIIQNFENALTAQVILTAFIPMLMNTGGNAGGQASATIIRGLSLNEIDFKDILKVMWKEIRVSFFCGLTLAVVNFGKVLVVDHVTLLVAAVISLTLVFVVSFSKLVGCALPILAKRLGFDPVVMANPLLSTICDAVTLIIYFNIATTLLGL